MSGTGGAQALPDASDVSSLPLGNGMIAICVRDNGVGIAADKLGEIFEPFVQVDSSAAGRAAGTGLGLAISRDLARGMGGDILVESVPGVGSTFTLRLPPAGSNATAPFARPR